MQSIYIMTFVAMTVSVALIGRFVYKRTGKQEKAGVIAAFFWGMVAFVASYWIQTLPLDTFIVSIAPQGSFVYAFFRSLYAPLTDEALKLVFVSVPFIYRLVDRRNFHLFALSLGLGFGIAEMWQLAGALSLDATIAALPWYMLTGFLSERVIACFVQGALLMVSMHMLLLDRLRGLGAAMFFHWVWILPQFVAVEIGIWNEYLWEIVLTQWVFVFGFVMLVLSKRILEGKI